MYNRIGKTTVDAKRIALHDGSSNLAVKSIHPALRSVCYTMSSQSQSIVDKLWHYCDLLRDDGMSSGDYAEQLTESHNRLSSGALPAEPLPTNLRQLTLLPE